MSTHDNQAGMPCTHTHIVSLHGSGPDWKKIAIVISSGIKGRNNIRNSSIFNELMALRFRKNTLRNLDLYELQCNQGFSG
jgi:hypothetical protein